MKFYDLNGNEIEKKEFIELYSKSYYLDEPRVKRVSQNSRYIEDYIDELLFDRGISCPKDVIEILAWKIGKIKHRDSQNAQRFVYSKDWANVESFHVNRYGKELDLSGFVEYIATNIENLTSKAQSDPQGVLNELKENAQAPKGIGTVYLITLLYFISKGKYPIYDRFAMMAVDAIIKDKKPGETVKYTELPDKNSFQFNQVFGLCQNEYIDKIEKIFGHDYLESRDIDRALWVYGHLFNNRT